MRPRRDRSRRPDPRAGAPLGGGGVRTPHGRRILRTRADAATSRFGGPLLLPHRAALVDALITVLPPDTVRTGAPATLADPGDAGRQARVTTPDGELEAALVVAADGIHSAVRRTRGC